jgi:hypothetical protein
MTMPSASPVAVELAAEVAPDVTRLVGENKAEFIALAGGWMRQKAALVAWPTLIAWLPLLVRLAVDLLLTRVGGLTIEDLIVALISHLHSKGLPADPALERFAAEHAARKAAREP